MKLYYNPRSRAAIVNWMLDERGGLWKNPLKNAAEDTHSERGIEHSERSPPHQAPSR
jgi:hypothetical protein